MLGNTTTEPTPPTTVSSVVAAILLIIESPQAVVGTMNNCPTGLMIGGCLGLAALITFKGGWKLTSIPIAIGGALAYCLIEANNNSRTAPPVTTFATPIS